MVRLDLGAPLQSTLATTLTRLVPGDGVEIMHLSTPSAVYLVRDDSLDDGAAVPATARFRIPAGAIWPIPSDGPRPLIAAVEGTVDVTLLATGAR